MSFKEKNVLVTGGASGIGAAIATRFAQDGANVIIVDIDGERAESLANELAEYGGTIQVQRVDLADEESIAACGEALREGLDSLSVIANCAGMIKKSAIVDTGHEDWDTQIAVHLRAPALMAKALLPLMQEAGGAIVNITSEGAFRPSAERWVYDAAKAGLGSLTRAMAVEFAPYGIRANAIAPGWIVTEMHFGGWPDPAARKRELETMDYPVCIMHRLGQPEEIAAAAYFLASDDASYITATTLHVDGGQGIH